MATLGPGLRIVLVLSFGAAFAHADPPPAPPPVAIEVGGGPTAAEGPSGTDAEKAWRSYVEMLLNDMTSNANARERAAALCAQALREQMASMDGRAPTTEPATTSDPFAHLAADAPDDLLVQWLVATASKPSTPTSTEAIANLQRLEPDNAAVWALSLVASPTSTEALQRMAAATRFDDHSADLLALWLDVVKRHPLADLADVVTENHAAGSGESTEATEFTMAATLSMTGFNTAPWSGMFDACKSVTPQSRDTTTAQSCIRTARTMLRDGTSVFDAKIGERILRKADALDQADQDRARHLAWWYANMAAPFTMHATSRYAEDYLSTGSEIEALRLAATRAGKADPPADWKSPAEQQPSMQASAATAGR